MSKEVNNEFLRLQELLVLEKRSDLEMYQKKMAGNSFKEKRELGVLWYPLDVEKTWFDAGERLLVKLSRSKEHQQSHSFQSGKSIRFFCNSDKEGEIDGVNGVINSVKGSSMTVTLSCDDVPKWIERGGIGAELLFDENTYREMEYALKKLIENEHPRTEELKRKLLGFQELELSPVEEFNIPHLNPSQNSAVELVRSTKDVALLHGPPGTGKTTTLIESIHQTLKTESQILVCAPSNAAVDLLVEKLIEKDISVVRIGHPARVTEEILNQTLDAKIATHPDYKLLKDLKKKSEEYFHLSGKWKRNFGSTEREQRKLMLTEARQLKTEAKKLSNYITNDVLIKTRVVASTLVGANHSKLKGMRFTTCFVDEAGQALEPANWIPVLKSDRIVFAGDHQQLPPTIKSIEAAKKGLNTTLFEKNINRNLNTVMLKEQYRMNEKIMNFSSSYFYQDELIANESVIHQKLFSDDEVVEFIDTAGTGYFESINRDTKSSFNKEEAKLLVRHLEQYVELLNVNKVDFPLSIGVISPYKAQIEFLKSLISESNLAKVEEVFISVNTIDSFQGQEKDVIYLSLVRSNEEGTIGFLSDERRMNVALTRAKSKLIVFGDSGTIAAKNQFYSKFVDYVQSIEAYKSAFEYLYLD